MECSEVCIFQVIAMEYAAGGTLFDLVDSKAKAGQHLEEEEVREINRIRYQIFFSGGPPFCSNSPGNAICPPEPDSSPRPEISKYIPDPLTGPCENWRLWYFKDPLQQEQSINSGGNALLHISGVVRRPSL